MPMTFPAHQGLILPAARKWPNTFDPLALSVGAAMPDVTDTILGFLINGYFKQWYGHALVGIFTLDFFGGLFITWLLARFTRRFLRESGRPQGLQAFAMTAPRQWSFSVFAGILSHIGFDLISHSTNLLFYPWKEDVRWFPDWWYTTWFKLRPLPIFGKEYSVGVFSILWGLLTLLGIFSFMRFLKPTKTK